MSSAATVLPFSVISAINAAFSVSDMPIAEAIALSVSSETCVFSAISAAFSATSSAVFSARAEFV